MRRYAGSSTGDASPIRQRAGGKCNSKERMDRLRLKLDREKTEPKSEARVGGGLPIMS